MTFEMTSSEVLIQAKSLIADPENWCKVNVAQNKDGKKLIFVDSEEATKFCAFVALLRIQKKYNYFKDKPNKLLQSASKQLFDATYIHVNDSIMYTHQDVMKMFDLAIEKSKKKELV